MCAWLRLQQLSKEAADYGLEYGLEVVNRYETNILNTAVQVGYTVGMALFASLPMLAFPVLACLLLCQHPPRPQAQLLWPPDLQ